MRFGEAGEGPRDTKTGWLALSSASGEGACQTGHTCKAGEASSLHPSPSLLLHPVSVLEGSVSKRLAASPSLLAWSSEAQQSIPAGAPSHSRALHALRVSPSLPCRGRLSFLKPHSQSFLWVCRSSCRIRWPPLGGAMPLVSGFGQRGCADGWFAGSRAQAADAAPALPPVLIPSHHALHLHHDWSSMLGIKRE